MMLNTFPEAENWQYLVTVHTSPSPDLILHVWNLALLCCILGTSISRRQVITFLIDWRWHAYFDKRVCNTSNQVSMEGLETRASARASKFARSWSH